MLSEARLRAIRIGLIAIVVLGIIIRKELLPICGPNPPQHQADFFNTPALELDSLRGILPH